MRTIPEGATHWSQADKNLLRLEAFWRPSINSDRGYDCWAITEHCEPYWQENCAPLPIYAVEIETPWTGAGLPPAGTVCERSFSQSTWKVTTICGHSTDGAYAAFYDGDGHMGWADDCKLRPIRTPEQVAAEEREKAIDDMVDVWKPSMGRFASEYRGLAEMLYKADYRKQPTDQ